jgi:hypothetical protein
MTLYDKARDMELCFVCASGPLGRHFSLRPASTLLLQPLFTCFLPCPNSWFRSQPTAARERGWGGGRILPPTDQTPLQNSLSFCEILHIADLLLAVRGERVWIGCVPSLSSATPTKRSICSSHFGRSHCSTVNLPSCLVKKIVLKMDG